MVSFDRLLDEFLPGRTVYVPGASGQVSGLYDALRQHPERAAGVRFFGCFVPGMNEVDYAGLHDQARVTTFMLPRAMRASFAAGRIDLVPRTYAGIADFMTRVSCDLAIAHVAPPGADGLCSFGIASDFAPIVWPRSRRRALIVNSAMPAMPRGPRVALADADVIVEAQETPIVAPAASPTREADDIARIVAALVPDGATIQTGIGGAPGAIWGHLRDHRGLRLRSGMANDGLRDLAEAGALAPGGQHKVGIAYGSLGFYNYLVDSDLVEFADTFATHGSAGLADVERLHAINSALEVDLFGQVNVEWQGSRLSSGVGGAPDFARAALASPGGRSIVALPATAKGGTISRIVPRLSGPATGLPRTDIDTVVTEFGVATLRDLGIDARAQALLSIAAPAFRDDLAEAWRALRATF